MENTLAIVSCLNSKTHAAVEGLHLLADKTSLVKGMQYFVLGINLGTLAKMPAFVS